MTQMLLLKSYIFIIIIFTIDHYERITESVRIQELNQSDLCINSIMALKGSLKEVNHLATYIQVTFLKM